MNSTPIGTYGKIGEKDDLLRAWLTAFKLLPTHNFLVVQTDKSVLLKKIHEAGGFGFGVTRAIKPPFYQRLIDGMTNSGWGHAIFSIGEEVGIEVRKRYPDVLDKKPSPRWGMNRSGHPVPLVEGIPVCPSKYEVVESQKLVAVTDLADLLVDGQQVVMYTSNWTMEQKVRMAVEAYSWVGEPYDIFEVGSWALPFFPNTSRLKVCSSLVAQILQIDNPIFKEWCVLKGLDIEKIAPRDIFEYGYGLDFTAHCFNCDFSDILAV